MQYSNYPRNYPSDFANLTQSIERFVLPGFIPEEPIFSHKSIIRTQGSCFAEHIHKELVSQELKSRYFQFYETINSPLANRIFFDLIVTENPLYKHPIHEKLFPLRTVTGIRQLLKNEDIFIFTVGVAGGWYDKSGHIPVINPDPKDLDNFKFRWLNVDQNIKEIKKIIENLKTINPNIKIVITLSPVPLSKAFGYDSPIVADCLSKSTLRIAIFEAIRGYLKDVYYWPSFEIVRWLGSHTNPVFGIDDGVARHVAKENIEIITKLFVKYFFMPKNS